jgi:hypothetical protein
MNKTTLTLETASSLYTFKVESQKVNGKVLTFVSAYLPGQPSILAGSVEGLFAMLPSEAVGSIVKSLEAMVESAEMCAR